MTSTRRLDFGGEPDHGGIQEFLKKFLPLQDNDNSVLILQTSREVDDEFLLNVSGDGMSQTDFGADPDH